jgi:predicted dehydrogenase
MRAEKRFKAGRRNFLKVMSIASLSNLPPLISNSKTTLAAPQTESFSNSFSKLDPLEELRIGMIGTYGHTGLVLDEIPAIHGARLVAYALQDGERMPEERVRREDADTISRDFAELKKHSAFRSDTRVYKTYQEMLSKEKLDVVGICLPYTLNVFASMAAAEQGIHVMSEKPLATGLDDLTQLQGVLERTGAQISAMLDMRLSPGIRTIHDAISRGVIGEPILATAQKSYKFGKDRPWFYKERKTYGGTIPWIGIHAIDFIIYTTGLRITQAAAMQSNKALHDYAGTEDNVGILLKLSNGGTAVVTLDYLRPESAGSHGDDRLRVIGSKGVVEMRGERVELITQDHALKVLPLLPKRSIFADFVAYLRGQGRHVILPGEAIAVNRICLLARQAADEQRIISV